MWSKARRAAHVLVADALFYSGALRLFQLVRRRLNGEKAYVLGFHRVLPAQERPRSHSLPGMILDEAVFADMLAYLSRRMQFVSLDAVLESPPATAKKPRCLVTFDDGWADTGTRAVPLLRHAGAPAVLFVPPGVVGSQEGFWIEQLLRAWSDDPSRLGLALLAGRFQRIRGHKAGREAVVDWLIHMPSRQRQEILAEALPPDGSGREAGTDTIMTWEQLTLVQEQGIEIGGHTVTHPQLTCEDEETVERELSLCRQLLQEKLGGPVRAFAYPRGDWNADVRDKVRAAGYACAFTTQPRCCTDNDDRFELPRFLLHDGNITGLRGKFSPAMLNLTLAGWA